MKDCAAMVIELAGVPAEVGCRFPENERFFEAYRSDRVPAFSVEATDDDLRRARDGLERQAARDGIPRRTGSMAFLENNALHALLAEQLVAHGALLLHGSALCMDGEAYIFVADSGTGKSTHARLWREAFGARVWMINDDKPFVRIEDGRAHVYGSPWDGKHHLSRNAHAPLRAVAQLERADQNRVSPLSAADAFQLLLRHAYTSPASVTMLKIVALEQALVRAADFYRLDCNMDTGAAYTAWRAMGSNAIQTQTEGGKE